MLLIVVVLLSETNDTLNKMNIFFFGGEKAATCKSEDVEVFSCYHCVCSPVKIGLALCASKGQVKVKEWHFHLHFNV